MTNDEKYFELIADGCTVSELISVLKNDDLSIIQAIKLVRSGYGYSLRDAKEQVTSHPAYKKVAEDSRPFHDSLWAQIDDSAD